MKMIDRKKQIEKNRKFTGIFLSFLGAFILLWLLSLLANISGTKELNGAGITLGFLFVFMLSAIFFMSVFLRRSLEKTIYSYRNIGLIGGIFFESTLAFCLFVNFLEAWSDGQWTTSEIYTQLLAFPRRFSYYALFILLFICVLLTVSNIALIRHEGFRPHNLLGIFLGVLYCGGTAVIFLVNDLLHEKVFLANNLQNTPLYHFLHTSLPLFLLLMLCYFECILAGAAVLGFQAARFIPDFDKDYIIILGCSIDKRGGLLPLLKGRVAAAARFAWAQEMESGKPCLYVPSGGQGPNEVMSEGSAMELFLLSKFAEPNEIFPEKKSKNTYENMLFSKKIIDEHNPDAKIAFATTNYHILRSGILARRAGFDAEGIAGDTKWYFWPNGFVREFIGILALNIPAHIVTAAIMAVISLAVGLTGYLGMI